MEIQLWKEILTPYDLAVKALLVKFNHIIIEYKSRDLYSPIEAVNGRVKSISSILEKCRKKNIPLEMVTEKVEDIAGIRIMCQFVEDIYNVVEIIRKRKDMVIVQEKDYINNAKPSGYRSYHIIAKYDVETMEGCKTISVEIQIRTLAMNFWATIEHSLQYKYRRNIPDRIRERLNASAEAILKLDKEMSSIHDEIMDAQSSYIIHANIVSDILNNIQNLYKIANKKEVVKIQDEFFEIYKKNNLAELRSFARQLDIMAEGYRAQNI